nr:GNAT family N-acetyltransferase [Nocardia brasiliensis]
MVAHLGRGAPRQPRQRLLGRTRFRPCGRFRARVVEFENRDDWAYLEWIAVAPDMQGHGIARRLVDVCSEALFARGARRIVTDVEDRNAASTALMTRSGFTPAATVTLFVRPNPDDPDPDSQIDAAAIAPGTKRALIRRGRLAGDNHRAAR